MSPIVLAIILLLGGLGVVCLSGYAKPPIMVTICFWIGIILALCGAVMILAPAVVWLDHQLRSILGA
jgi:hypothetical protein